MMELFHKLRQDDEPMVIKLLTKAISKERPRSGRSGHMYTPERTRKFEKMMAEVAGTLRRNPYTCPVKVTVTIWEPIPKSFSKAKRQAAELGLFSPQVGDLDNKVKAITDGLNGIAYLDDKQVNCIKAERGYSDDHAIYIQIERNGLSLVELEQHGKSRNSKGRA